MAKRRSGSKKKLKAIPEPEVPITRSTGETPAADALTVCWMLAALITLLASLAVVLFELFVMHGEQQATPGAQVFQGVLAFSSITTGLIGLLFTLLVYRVRRQAPPRNVTIVVVVICALPLLVSVLRAM